MAKKKILVKILFVLALSFAIFFISCTFDNDTDANTNTNTNTTNTDSSSVIPTKLVGISSASSLVLLPNSKNKSDSTVYSLNSLDEYGHTKQLIFQNSKGETINYPVAYVYKPTDNYLIIFADQSFNNISRPETDRASPYLRAGILLVEIDTEKIYTLTPPSIQEFIDKIDIGEINGSMWADVIRVGNGSWYAENGFVDVYNPGNFSNIDMVIFKDNLNNLFYCMDIYFTYIDYTNNINENLHYQELIYLNTKEKTQTRIYGIKVQQNPSTLYPIFYDKGYFMDKNSNIFITFGINDNSVVTKKYDRFGNEIGTISNKPDIYGKYYFYDMNNNCYYITTYANPGIYKFNDDGSSSLVKNLNGFFGYNLVGGIFNAIYKINNDYYYLANRNIDEKEKKVLIKFFDGQNFIDDENPIILTDKFINNYYSKIIVSNKLYILLRVENENNNTLLYYDFNNNQINEFNKINLNNYIINNISYSFNKLVVNVLDPSTMKFGIIYIDNNNTISDFIPLSNSSTLSGGTFQIIALN